MAPLWVQVGEKSIQHTPWDSNPGPLAIKPMDLPIGIFISLYHIFEIFNLNIYKIVISLKG